MKTEPRIGVGLADGQMMLVEALASVIDAQADMRVVLRAGGGEEFLGGLPAAHAEVCVISSLLPDLDGIEVVRRLKVGRDGGSPRVIVYAEHADPWLARRAIQTGADGFLSKDEHAHTLVEAIRSVAGGIVYLASSLARALAADGDEGRMPHELLSPREAEVFMLIALGHTTTEIAAETYLDPRTVSTYRRRILDKMGLLRNSDVVAYAIKHRLLDR